MLSDPASERAILSGIITYGENVYLDIADIISENSFTIDTNSIIYKCIKQVYETSETKTIDIPSIYSAAKQLGCDSILSQKSASEHLKSVIDFPVERDNLRKFASTLKKLEIARTLKRKLELAGKKIGDLSGTESIGKILAIAEDTVFDFGSSIADTENQPMHIGEEVEEYLDYLINNPIDNVGISTGFPIYDQAIGGGLRKSTVNVIAARPKTGKTLLSDNMGFHIASKLQIPVLNLDTEMTHEDHIHRILAMISSIEINKIETGKFADSNMQKQKVLEAAKLLKDSKYYYKSIAGKPFDEQLSVIKRWLVKDVGLNADGTAKDCVIFYDYLKLMDSQGMSQDMKEYQVLGFMMTSLHNLANKYKIPIVSFIQLNRDGITKESTDTASGSDRIIWLCSNFTIFKRKSDEEIAEDGPNSGNRKLIPVISRHGGGLDDNDYINCNMEGWCARITEGDTKLEIKNNTSSNNDGFIINEQSDETIDFV